VVLTATGILLMFYYVPSVEQAHNRMLDLDGTVAFGVLLRNMHRWAAHGMVALVFLHLCRVFYTGSYRAPREFNWVIGVLLFLLTLGASFTGYLLPWDQLAFWAITVGTAIAGYAPVVGEQVRFLLLGDQVVGQEALIRFYVLHVAVIPVAITVLVAVHFWRIRKDGGLSRPENLDAPESQPRFPEALEGKLEGLAPLAKTAKAKTFGVLGMVRGPFNKVGNTPDNTVYSWPNLFIAELFCFALTVLVIRRWPSSTRPSSSRPTPRTCRTLEGSPVLPRPPGDGLLLGLLGGVDPTISWCSPPRALLDRGTRHGVGSPPLDPRPHDLTTLLINLC
jgi:quinol-cytochrome oxidoreductase complex cytochrome b subunit